MQPDQEDRFPDDALDFIADAAHVEARQKLAHVLKARGAASEARKMQSDVFPALNDNDIDVLFNTLVQRLETVGPK